MSFHYLPTKAGGFVKKSFDSLTNPEKEYLTEVKKEKPPYSAATAKRLMSILETPKKETNDSND